MSDHNASSLSSAAPAMAGDDARDQKRGPVKELDESATAQLDAMGLAVAKLRSEAIAGRSASGIETQWEEDEEFYAGIDAANRDEMRTSVRTKPPGQTMVQARANTRSTVFPNLTRPYCDAGAARFSDMVLPGDDKNYEILPTTMPDLVSLAGGKYPRAIAANARKMQDQQAAQQMLAAAQQQAQAIVEEAKEKAEKAEEQIEDWHIDCQFHAEVRKVIEDAGRIGSGVLKGPVPYKSRAVAFDNTTNTLIIKDEIKPGSKQVRPQNCYPDPACGQNIHNGSYFLERDFLTNKEVQGLMGLAGYIEPQIKSVLDEGPKQAVVPTENNPGYTGDPVGDKRFEVWYFYGDIKTADMETAQVPLPELEAGEERPETMHAIVTLINNKVVKCALNPLDTGDFPYDVFPWQRKDGMPWGDGVARQGRTAQRIVTSGWRNMMDNMGLSAGVQIVLMQGMLSGANGSDEITGRKLWYVAEDADIDDVRKAMQFFEIPSRQKELKEIILDGMKLMEDATGLPMLLQGQQGTAPDTVGGMNLLNNNASAVLRRLARMFDDFITEPHVRRYYAWLLQYAEDDSMKGDFTIDARGSSALVERDLQSQEIQQLLPASLNVAYGIDPKKTMTEWLKARKFYPKNFEYDDEKWQQIVAGLSAKPPDSKVQVQQIKEQGEAQRQKADQSFQATEAAKDRNLQLVLDEVNQHIEEMKLTGAQQMGFEELKAMLEGIVIKTNAAKETSAATLAVDVHKHHNLGAAALMPPAATPTRGPSAPVEPPGRAPNGQAFAL